MLNYAWCMKYKKILIRTKRRIWQTFSQKGVENMLNNTFWRNLMSSWCALMEYRWCLLPNQKRSDKAKDLKVTIVIWYVEDKNVPVGKVSSKGWVLCVTRMNPPFLWTILLWVGKKVLWVDPPGRKSSSMSRTLASKDLDEFS